MTFRFLLAITQIRRERMRAACVKTAVDAGGALEQTMGCKPAALAASVPLLACKLLILKQLVVVEVAGIEPASEGLQRTEPTCVSDSLGFADASFERARTQRR